MSKAPEKTVGRTFAAILLAILIAVSCAVSFIAVIPLGNKHAALNQASDNARRQLQRYEVNAARMQSKFADSMFSKAISASLAYTGEGADLKKIADTLLLKSVNITDENGVITAAYPEDLLGKRLKDMDDTIALNPIAKNIVLKKVGKIIPQGNGKYLVYVGAARVDLPEGKTGAVVVTAVTDTYEEAYGANVADECGDNVILEKNGETFSNSFAEAKDKTISSLAGSNNGKPFKLTLGGKTYDAKVINEGEFKALVAAEAKDNSLLTFLIIAAADLILLGVGCVLLFVLRKPKNE